ncbi:MAG: FlgD immunoglobulin-like domain containing protein [Candidatus Eisenbacteria bacterium]|nr:FlgD immunoglobulin-like domain containing protein [Candidatus Eisenbacteria bacterium]
MKKSLVVFAALSFLVSTLCLSDAYAQTGSLEGIVHIPGGGPLPGAEVVAKNLPGMTVAGTAVADSTGHYFMDLPYGMYRAEASKPGFNMAFIDSIRIDAGVPHAFRDFFLAPQGGAGVPPQIIHFPPVSAIANQPLMIFAIVTDSDLDLSAVELGLKHDPGQQPIMFPMVRAQGDTFRVNIPSGEVNGTILYYFIRATDAAQHTMIVPLPGDPQWGALGLYSVSVGQGGGTSGPPFIVHTPSPSAPAGLQLEIRATVTDPDGNLMRVDLGYLPDQLAAPFWVQMVRTTGDEFAGQIPASYVRAPAVAYCIEAEDVTRLRVHVPSPTDSLYGTKGFFFVPVRSGSGNVPVITHTPPTSLRAGENFSVEAMVTDPDGDLREVGLLYGPAAAMWVPIWIPMANSGGSLYSTTIPGTSINTPGILYHVEAKDVSGNLTQLPDPFMGPSEFFVQVMSGVGNPPIITHTRIVGPVPANQGLTVRASVTDPDIGDYIREVGIDVARPGFPPLHYTMVPDAALGGVPNYVGTIPASDVQVPGFNYRIIAQDGTGNMNSYPAFTEPAFWVDVTSGAGGGHAPAVRHSPVSQSRQAYNPIQLGTVVTDEDGDLVEVQIEMEQAGYAPKVFLMWRTAGADSFAGQIPGPEVKTPGFNYRISARDVMGNKTSLPSFQYPAYWVNVTTGAATGNPPTIMHTAVTGPVSSNLPLRIRAYITDSDPGDIVNMAEVKFEMPPAAPRHFMMWRQPGFPDSFIVDIPGPEIQPPGFSYRINAQDMNGNTGNMPTIQSAPYWVNVGGAGGVGSPPTITHQVISGMKPQGMPIKIKAVITDPDAGDYIMGAGIQLEKPGFPERYLQMWRSAGGADTFEVEIPGPDISPPGFEYRITARDSYNNNSANPSFQYDPYWVDVGGSQGQGRPPVIAHTPPNGSQPAGVPVQISAIAADPDSGDRVIQVGIKLQQPGMADKFFPLMVSPARADSFYGQIPGPEVYSPGFSYRIDAVDSYGNHASMPLYQYPAYWVDVGGAGGGVGSPPTIVHTSPSGTQPQGATIMLTATITDPDIGDKVQEVRINLERPDLAPISFPMFSTAAKPDSFTGQIPGTEVRTPGFSYRISARDMNGNYSTVPSFQYPSYWVNVGVGSGTGNPPTIVHQPPSGTQTALTDLVLRARITDPDAGDFVREAFLEMYQPSGATNYFPMTPDTGSTYFARIPGPSLFPPGFGYRIFAKDSGSNQASSPRPQDKPYWVDVVAGKPTGQPPAITYTPPAGMMPQGIPISVSVIARDPDSGDRVVEVSVQIDRPGMPPSFYTLNPSPARADSFIGAIPGGEVQPPGLSYRVNAKDSFGNIATVPGFQYPSYWVMVGTGGGAGAGNPPAIVHVPPSGPQSTGKDVVLTARITDPDAGDTVMGAGIELQKPGFPPMFFPLAVSPSKSDSFTGIVPGPEVTFPGFNYRISAKDSKGNMGVLPSYQYPPYWIDVPYGAGAGNPPTILHTPLAGARPSGIDVRLTAKVTDTDPGDFIREVFLEAYPSVGPPMRFPAIPDTGSLYIVTIFAPSVNPPGFGYRFMARDSQGNTSSNPKAQDKPYWLNVTAGTGMGTSPRIVHSVIPSPQEAGKNIDVRAQVTDPDSGDVIQEVILEFTSGSMPPAYYPMTSTSYRDSLGVLRTYYYARIPGPNVVWPGFGYRIGAKDSQGNKAMLPEPQYAPYWVEVKSQAAALNPPTIVHSKIASPQQEFSNIKVTATVTDLDRNGNRVNVPQVFIDMKTPFGSGKLFMRSVGDPLMGNFEVEIPGAMVNPPGFGYRVIAQDNDGNQSANPGWQYDPYWIEVGRYGSTGNPPRISHMKVTSPRPKGMDIQMEATVSDPDSGDYVDKVMVDVQPPNCPPMQFPLAVTRAVSDSSGGGTLYSGVIPGYAVNFPGFNYKIRAFDSRGAMGEDPLSMYPPYWVEVHSASGGTSRPPQITHQPVAGAQPGKDVLIRAQVTDPDSVKPGSDISRVELVVYSRLNPREDHFPMTPWFDQTTAKSYYQGVVPPNLVVSPGFGYRIVAVDGADARAELPQPQYPPFSVEVMGAGTPPAIVHSVVPQASSGSPVTIKATITDDTGVREAVVQFSPPTGAPSDFLMQRVVGNDYQTTLPGFMILPPGFGYRIRATDVTGGVALSPDPSRQPYYVAVAGLGGGRPPEITLEPIRSDTIVTGRPVQIRATVFDPDGPTTGPTGIFAEIMTQRLQAMAQPLNFPMMEDPGQRGKFTGMIPGDMVAPPGFVYGVKARDSQGMVSMNPAPPNPPFTINIQGNPAGQPPRITHAPIPEVQTGADLVVSASVTDPDSPLGRVFFQYMKLGAQNPVPVEINMTLVSGSNYTARVPSSAIEPPSILYNIVAMDATGNRTEIPGYPMNWFMVNVKGQGAGRAPQIFHTPLASAAAGIDVKIRAKVTDDKDSLVVFLGYMSPASGPDPKRKLMVRRLDPVTGERMYEGTLEGTLVVPPGFAYGIEAVDIDGNHTMMPVYPNPLFFVQVRTGAAANVPPNIVHTPVMSSNSRTPIPISAAITDDDSVRSASVVYMPVRPGALPFTVNLSKSGDTYTGMIPGTHVLPPGLKYSIMAEDSKGGRSVNPAYPRDAYFVEVRTTLALDEPADFTVTKEDSITVKGQDTGGWAKINNVLVTHWTGTNFREKVALLQGLNLIGVMGSDSTIVERRVTRDTAPPQTAPVLVQPARGTELNTGTVTFGWGAVSDGASYILHYSKYLGFPDTATQVVRTADLFYSAPSLRDGRWFWRVKAVDAAGNVGTVFSQVWEFVVNTTILAPPQIDKEDLLADANKDEITVNGTAKPGSIVTLYIHGASLENSGNMVIDITINATRATDRDGIFSIPGVRLFQGDNIITAIARDGTGVSALSEPITVIHDTNAPLAPVVSEIKGNTIYGVAEPGVTIRAYTGSAGAHIDSLTLDGSTTADATNGKFSYQLSLVDGTYHIGLVAVDQSGNYTTGKSSTDLGDVTIDTTKPLAPAITYPADRDTLTFNIITVIGSELSSDARTVAVYVGDDVVGKGVVASGAFNARVALVPGENALYAVCVDRAGNISDYSDTVVVFVRTGSITVSDLSPADDPATLFANESYVDTNTPRITGTVGGATDVGISIDSGPVVAVTHSISYTTSALAEGAHTFTVWARNATDSISVPVPFAVDTNFPTIDTLAVAGGDTLINHGVPQLYAEISDAGVGIVKSGIAIVANGEAVRDRDNLVYNSDTGKIWYVPSSPMADGIYNVSLWVTDGAGNRVHESHPAFRVDTTPPYLLIAVSPPFPVKIFGITKHFMLTVVFANERLRAAPEVTYIGTLGDSGSISVSGPNRDAATGLYYYTNVAEKPDGNISRSLTARGTDIAGNLGIATEAFILASMNGAQGGTITNNEGIGVTIPGGATDTTVTVSITTQQSDTTSAGGGAFSTLTEVATGASHIMAQQLGTWGISSVKTYDIPSRVGKIYSFGPDGMVFDVPVSLTLSYAAQSGKTETSKLGLYTYLGTGLGWEFVPSILNADTKSVTGETTHFSRYALATDAEEPEIVVQSPLDSSLVTSNLNIYASLSDNLSGIDVSSVRLTINGSPVDLQNATITDTSFSYQTVITDLSRDYTVVLSTDDKQGNTGTMSLLLRAATSILVTKFEANAKSPEEVEVTWEAAGNPEGGFRLYKADGASPKAGAFQALNKDALITGAGAHLFSDKAVQSGSTYSYRLGHVDASGVELYYGEVQVTLPSALPRVYDLKQNFPNPMTGVTEIKYQLPKASKVTLRVFNAKGQLVATLVEGKLPPGYYVKTWNGKTLQGKDAASGVYFYRLDAQNYSRTRKLVLIK